MGSKERRRRASRSRPLPKIPRWDEGQIGFRATPSEERRVPLLHPDVWKSRSAHGVEASRFHLRESRRHRLRTCRVVTQPNPNPMSNSAKSSSFRAAAKGPKVKARMMYLDESGEMYSSPLHPCFPVAILPADDAAYDQMVEQGTDVLCTSPCGRKDQAPAWFRANKRAEIISVLKSIGIRRSTKGDK